MDESQQLSSLIGEIYDADLDPARWMAVLEPTSRFVRGPAATLFYRDAAKKAGSAVYNYGIAAHFAELYFSKYIKLDPASTSQFFAAVDEPWAASEFLDPSEFVDSRFYKEWAQPQRHGLGPVKRGIAVTAGLC